MDTYDSKSKAAISSKKKNKMRLCLFFGVKFICKFMYLNIFPEWPLITFLIIKIVIFEIIIISFLRKVYGKICVQLIKEVSASLICH